MIKSLISLNPGKILIRSTNWIGDAIMTTPAVRTIRENFPRARISILANPWVADVFSASPYVDEVVLFNKKSRHTGLADIRRLSRELAEYNFDMAILLQNAFQAALIALLAGIPVRAGYRRDARGLLLTHGVKIRREVRKMHQVHYYQALLADLGLKRGPDDLFLQLPEEVVVWAKEYLEKTGSGPFVGLNPGAAYGPAKRWPAEKYGRLAARLAEEMGATVLVFGTAADKKAAAAISAMAPGKVIDLAGGTTLAQAMALIGRCGAFVTNDSGLMHVGAALKTPLVAIFGSTDNIATGPFSDNAVVIKKHMDCSPCLKTDCKADFRCMMDISVEEVFAAVRQLLGTGEGGKSS